MLTDNTPTIPDYEFKTVVISTLFCIKEKHILYILSIFKISNKYFTYVECKEN